MWKIRGELVGLLFQIFKMRQLSLFPKSQPFETILIKENEVISDSSTKKIGGAKESREISLEGFMLNYKRPWVSGQSILQKSHRKKPSSLQQELQLEVLGAKADTCTPLWHRSTSMLKKQGTVHIGFKHTLEKTHMVSNMAIKHHVPITDLKYIT